MIKQRQGNVIYDCDGKSHKHERKNTLQSKIEHKEVLLKKLSNENTDGKYDVQIRNNEEILRRLKRTARYNNNSNLKITYKKIPFKKLKQMTIDYIKNLDRNYITKEELSKLFKVHEHDIEKVFMQLNLEGILSQRNSNFAHDTNRNPIFPMPVSGWACDLYYIRQKGGITDDI